jgi:prophage tail gpP-like protein
LSGIAERAYGDPGLWPRIYNANQSAIKSGDQNLIAIGEVLIIPLLPEEEALRARFLTSGQITDGPELKIEERIIPTQSMRVLRTMDTGADAWTAVIAWEPGLDKRLDELTAPYAYPRAQVSLDGELKITGHLYRIKPKTDGSGTQLELSGFSKTIDAVDSTLRPPYEANNVTLDQRCRDLLTPLEIGLEIAPGVNLGGQIARAIAKPTDKVFAHLATLAEQKKLLLSSTPLGDALLTTADLTSPAVGTIEEGVSQVSSFEADFDGRKRFNVYQAIGKGANKFEQKFGVAKDNLVPRSRFATFRADDSLKGEMNEIAAWRRNKTAAEALRISLEMSGWLAPNNKQWTENTRLTVKSKTLRIPNGFTLLITQVEYVWDEDGKTTNLSLLPPTYYSGGNLAEIVN